MKPIIYSTEMVQSLLKNLKTMTRRTGGLEQINTNPDEWEYVKRTADKFHFRKINSSETTWMCYPKFLEGDILWVRESFGIIIDNTEGKIVFKADVCSPDVDKPTSGWKPPIHMPFQLARIFLEVTDVRAERLQDISEEDAIAEGIKMVGENPEFGGISYSGKWYENYGETGYSFLKPIVSFSTLWQKINGKKHPWDSNPWVWVYTFKRIEKPENF